MKLNYKGFSMIEAIVVLGLLALISAGLVQLNLSFSQILFFFIPSYTVHVYGPVYIFGEGIAGYSSMQVAKFDSKRSWMENYYWDTSVTNYSPGSSFCYTGGGGMKVALTNKTLLTLGVSYIHRAYTTHWNYNDGIMNTNGNITENDSFNNIIVSTGFTVVL